MGDYTGEIFGYGSAFGGPPDSYGDVIMPGCFTRTLAEWRAQKRGPQMLWMHDIEAPIGAWATFEEDNYGLRLEGRVTLNSSRGADAHALLADHALDGLSIGFLTRKARVDEKTGVRYILDVDLYEVSVVGFPANLRARVNEVKREKSLLDLIQERNRIFLSPTTSKPDVSLSDLLASVRARNLAIASTRC